MVVLSTKLRNSEEGGRLGDRMRLALPWMIPGD